MELFCPVEFEKPEIQVHVTEDFEAMIASMKEEYYFYLEKENDQHKREPRHGNRQQAQEWPSNPVERIGNVNGMANLHPAYRDMHAG